MQISGDSINTFTIFINKFKPIYKAGLSWIRVSDMSWKAVDRFNESDQYESDVTITSSETNIDEFLTEIEANRQDTSYFTLSAFNDGEKIFGANIDYSNNLVCVIPKIGNKKQVDINVYSITVTFKLIMDKDTIGLFNAGSSLPELLIYPGYDIKTDRTIEYLHTYNDTTFSADRDTDAGVLSVTVIFDHDDMSLFRNYIRNVRDSAFSLPEIAGVSEPFGYGTTWPVSVKCKKFQDTPMDEGVKFWKCSIEFVQDF